MSKSSFFKNFFNLSNCTLVAVFVGLGAAVFVCRWFASVRLFQIDYQTETILLITTLRYSVNIDFTQASYPSF